jgi:hypothetical protein
VERMSLKNETIHFLVRLPELLSLEEFREAFIKSDRKTVGQLRVLPSRMLSKGLGLKSVFFSSFFFVVCT